MRNTEKNKGGFINHEKHTEIQLGGQTNGKSNYTFYYAGRDPAGLFNTFPSTCPQPQMNGCPGEPGKASLPWITDGICDSDNNLYLCSSYTSAIYKVNSDGYTSVLNPGGVFVHAMALTFGRQNTWPLYVASSLHFGYRIQRLLENGTADTEYNNLGIKTISASVTGFCCDNNNRLYYTSGSNIYRANLPTDLFSSHVKLTQDTTGNLDGPIATSGITDLTAKVGTLGQCRYNLKTNSVFFYDITYTKIRKLDLSANIISSVGTCLDTEGRTDCVFSISPTTNILYYMQKGGSRPTSIYTFDITTGVSKKYSGGGTAEGGKTLYNTLLGFGTAVKTSTVYTDDASFTGTAIHPDNPLFLAVDSTDSIICTKSESAEGSRIYLTSPIPPAIPPTSITLNAATPNSLTIAWSNDTHASSYEFTISPSATIPVVPATATTAIFTGLIESTSYTITIIAKNRRGASQPKSITCLTSIDTTNFVLQPAFSSSLSLLNNTPSIISCLVSWTGISRVQQITYRLTPISPGASGATGATGPPITGTIPSNANPYAITGLQQNVSYALTITGSLLNIPTNPVTGNSAYSVTSNSVTFTTKPLLPVYMGTLVGPKSNSSPSGPLRNTTLNLNRGIVQDNANNIYLSSGTCIYKVSPSESTTYYLFDTSQVYPTPVPISKPHVGLSASSISLFAGSSSSGTPSTGQTGSSIKFGNIVGMTYYRDALYVTDSTNNVVVQISTVGAPTSTVLGSNSFNNPRDIIRGIDNNLYIADYNNNCISVLNTTTNAVSKLLTTPPGAASDSLSKITLSISNPSSLVQLPDGSFYVACTTNHTIQKLTPYPLNPGTYSISLFAGTLNNSGNADGANASAKFSSPNGLLLDSANNLYVCDSGNYSVRVIIGQIVYTYLGGSSGNTDGPASSGKFKGDTGQSSLTKLFFDVNNNLYLSDTGNGALRAVTNYPVDQVITDTQLTNYRASAAQASSAVAQVASSAVAQNVSSALAQAISGAQESSAVAQAFSSAVAQTASSAIQIQALVKPLSIKDELLQTIRGLEKNLKENRDIIYSPQSSQHDKNVGIDNFTYYMDEMKNTRDELDAIYQTIFSIAPKYQDRNLQTRVSSPYLESMGFIKLYDAMRKGYVVIDSNGYLVENIETPYKRHEQLISTPVVQPPSVSTAAPQISYTVSMPTTSSPTTLQMGGGALNSGPSRPSGPSGTLSSGILPTDILVSNDATIPGSSPWRAYFDPDRRLYFYTNTATNTMQFEHPFPPTFLGSDDIIIDSTTKFLPNGWIKLKNSSASVPYYFNIISTETSWVHPNLPPSASRLSPVTDVTLNYPYKKYIDPATNKIFYVNTLTQESQWNFPDEAFNRGPSTAQQASSAVAQAISGAQQSSAVAQVASSALAQAISGAQESSAVAQVASSALAQTISGAQASSADAQAVSGAQQSSAVAQVASSALAQAISGARESSAVAQVASSALAQTISGAQVSSAMESSAVAQVASSALAQAISGAQQSSAVAQVASSALAQAISGAQQSSAVAQMASSAFERRTVSSADAQVASSALAQAISGAQASSAHAQQTSSAQASSAVAQVASQAVASSAQAEAALSGFIRQKDDIKSYINESKTDILTMINRVYSTSGRASAQSVNELKSMIGDLMEIRNELKTVGANIFRFRDYYQDTSLQTVVPEPNLRVSGAKKVYDSLRNTYLVVDSNGSIIPNPATPATRSYTTFSMRGGDSVLA